MFVNSFDGDNSMVAGHRQGSKYLLDRNMYSHVSWCVICVPSVCCVWYRLAIVGTALRQTSRRILRSHDVLCRSLPSCSVISPCLSSFLFRMITRIVIFCGFAVSFLSMFCHVVCFLLHVETEPENTKHAGELCPALQVHVMQSTECAVHSVCIL